MIYFFPLNFKILRFIKTKYKAEDDIEVVFLSIYTRYSANEMPRKMIKIKLR